MKKIAKYNPDDGVPKDTVMLAVATLVQGEMQILGNLRDNNDTVRADLMAVMRDQAKPGHPMHLVEVKVVGRILSMEEIVAPLA